MRKAHKKIAEAKREKDPYRALSAISDAVFGYIGDKLETDSGAVIFDEAAIRMTEKGIDEETIDELKQILDKVDAARFSPTSEIEQNVHNLADKTGEMLRKIDRTIGNHRRKS